MAIGPVLGARTEALRSRRSLAPPPKVAFDEPGVIEGGPLARRVERFEAHRGLHLVQQIRSASSTRSQVIESLERGGDQPTKVSTYVRSHTMLRHLKGAMKAAKMQPLTWDEATRHTFASQWVMHERPIEKLAQTLGHGSTWVTERYAHLRDDYLPADCSAFDTGFGTADGEAPTRVPAISDRDGGAAISSRNEGTWGR